MTGLARSAYAYARVRARKSRILTPSLLAALTVSDDPALTIAGWRDIDATAGAAPLMGAAYRRFIADCALVVAGRPDLAEAVRALIGLHENENVKLAWRAIARARNSDAWRPLWRPLDGFATVDVDRCAAALSLVELVESLRRSPFGPVAADALRLHGADAPAAELLFDRAAIARIARARADLPAADTPARALLTLVVFACDVAVLEAVMGGLHVAPRSALGLTSIAAMLSPREQRALEAWIAGGSSTLVLPRRFDADAPVRTLGDLRRALGAALDSACRRAFRASPRSAAAPLALVLRRDEELRALVTAGELRARHATASVAARVLAGDG
jgi:hypothetical protein